ncbi:MAG: tRNA (cytidine(34)-2'-O)-methyltransferase [Actinobacteria bacterium]|nr:tRNA (cytidine(34)-2'-O)-methyltransferase [Actinomycetota bacterium]
MDVVLLQPSIAPNTGAIIRLCANTGCRLHLVEPLGFSMDDRLLRRGGLDYHEYASVTIHETLDDARSALVGDWYAFSAKASKRYTDIEYVSSDVLLFGNERTGLPQPELESVVPDHRLTIPMQPNNRSLNLANAVSVVVYEAWRQVGFASPGPGTAR